MRDFLRRFAVGIALLAAPFFASAQVIDRIDIQRVGEEAEIHIRFITRVQYMRHAPVSEGKDLRVFFALAGSEFRESDLMQESKRSPKTDLIPRFNLVYPELTNAMLITFDRSTRFRVRQGGDGFSLVITVPVLPGALDESAGKGDKLRAAEKLSEKKPATQDPVPLPTTVPTTPPKA
ncbi:MAG: hypothetical protein EG825_07650, partial [Rhodocyclaceae bacterium]|nr:hypothetical protein [Rhodocyclaceae bacterium]